VANRGARRDFVDLAEILQIMPLREVLHAYKEQFKPEPAAMAHTSRALSYFGDAESTPDLINTLNKRDWEQIKLIVQRSVRSPNFVHTTRAPLQAMPSNPHLATNPTAPTARALLREKAIPQSNQQVEIPAVSVPANTPSPKQVIQKEAGKKQTHETARGTPKMKVR